MENLAHIRRKIKEVGDVIVDGFGVGDINTEVLNEREVLGREGVVLVAVRYNPIKKKLIGKIQINTVECYKQGWKVWSKWFSYSQHLLECNCISKKFESLTRISKCLQASLLGRKYLKYTAKQPICCGFSI